MSGTWFITGTSSGFGRLLTERLLARGDRVAATLRQPRSLDGLRAEYGEQLWTAQLDVTDSEQAHRVVDDAFHELGVIDVVVNNAGYGVFASVEEAADEQIRRVIDTNLLGSINVIRAALPHLRAQRRGRPCRNTPARRPMMSGARSPTAPSASPTTRERSRTR
jgi:NAD(P)-dependent dehydrogenase (short-subunit alcohol dehydrogenase family)